MAELAAGRVTWIGLSPAPRAAPHAVAEVEALAERGLDGDHHALRRAGSRRQVTLIQAEHLRAVAAELARPVAPELCRRNLVVEGLELRSCHGRVLQVGAARLEISGDCEPCARMEENLGPGGLAAMKDRGGLTARVLRGGRIRIGDAVRVEEPPPAR